jgi:hypothetical protein
MDREKLWKIFVKANPSFGREGYVTMSARGLRKLFDTTWDQAEQEAVNRFRIPTRSPEELFNCVFKNKN